MLEVSGKIIQENEYSSKYLSQYVSDKNWEFNLFLIINYASQWEFFAIECGLSPLTVLMKLKIASDANAKTNMTNLLDILSRNRKTYECLFNATIQESDFRESYRPIEGSKIIQESYDGKPDRFDPISNLISRNHFNYFIITHYSLYWKDFATSCLSVNKIKSKQQGGETFEKIMEILFTTLYDYGKTYDCLYDATYSPQSVKDFNTAISPNNSNK